MSILIIRVKIGNLYRYQRTQERRPQERRQDLGLVVNNIKPDPFLENHALKFVLE